MKYCNCSWSTEKYNTYIRKHYEDVISDGRRFQVLTSATGNARSPIVKSRVIGKGLHVQSLPRSGSHKTNWAVFAISCSLCRRAPPLTVAAWLLGYIQTWCGRWSDQTGVTSRIRIIIKTMIGVVCCDLLLEPGIQPSIMVTSVMRYINSRFCVHTYIVSGALPPMTWNEQVDYARLLQFCNKECCMMF